MTKRLNAALVAAFAVTATMLLGVFPAAGQIKGVPTSVTSIGFGGHFDRFPGIPASVTSLGPRGYNDSKRLFTGTSFPSTSFPPANSGQLHRHPRSGQFYPSRGFYPVPYTPVYIIDPSLSYTSDDSGAAQNQNDSAGPTIFDRRAAGESSQSAEADYPQRIPQQLNQRSDQGEPAEAPAAPVQDEPQTLLLFKDGRQLEVENYAIVGNLLYDLTPGRRGKIALSDLDLPATAKQNDERGIDFQTPSSAGLN